MLCRDSCGQTKPNAEWGYRSSTVYRLCFGVNFLHRDWGAHRRVRGGGGLYSPVVAATPRLLCGLNATTHKSLSLVSVPRRERERPLDCFGIKSACFSRTNAFFFPFSLKSPLNHPGGLPIRFSFIQSNLTPHLSKTIAIRLLTSLWELVSIRYNFPRKTPGRQERFPVFPFQRKLWQIYWNL